MGTGLSTYGRRFLLDEAGTVALLTQPLLVWEAAGGDVNEAWLTTGAGQIARRPSAGDPLVFELRKVDQKGNAFALGITVGRTENNDVVLPDQSVSRFHAYFQLDSRLGGWKLVDAESKNGTWVGALKLNPNEGQRVVDKMRLRFGDVEMIFLEPKSFIEYLTDKMTGGHPSKR